MIFAENNEPITCTSAFCRAYDALDNRTKGRVKRVITAACGISNTTFYKWLATPDIITSHNDKLMIADVFNIDVKELFPKSQKND